MSNITNPFLKDYSQTSLLKRNYGVLQLNSQVKQNKFIQIQQNKFEPKNGLQTSRISNPFSRQNSSLSNIINNKQNIIRRQLNGNINSHTQQNNRSFSESKINSFKVINNQYNTKDYLNRNNFYKGLEDIGSRQLWKTQFQKQAKYRLKNYGPQSLKYQYLSSQKYTSNTSNKQIPNVQTPSFNRNITSQYYGYNDLPNTKYNSKSTNQISYNKHISSYQSDYNQYSNSKYHQITKFSPQDSNQAIKDQQEFLIQRTNKKKSSLKKQTNQKSKPSHNKHSYFDEIPEDRNQDLATMKEVNRQANNFESMDSYLESITNKQSLKKNQQFKRSSIQNIHQNYSPQLSASSGFGASSSSQMYQSGANFRFRSSFNKQGPLNALTFDKNSDQEQDQVKQSSINRQASFPQTLEYNNKIYYKI